MAIKIIKEGTKQFTYVCPYCGCEFTCENEDIYFDNRIQCPWCHSELTVDHRIIDKSNSSYPTEIPVRRGTETVPEETKIWYGTKLGQSPITPNPCETCHVYQKMMKGEYTVDDSCFWCPNNPCKVTCNSK